MYPSYNVRLAAFNKTLYRLLNTNRDAFDRRALEAEFEHSLTQELKNPPESYRARFSLSSPDKNSGYKKELSRGTLAIATVCADFTISGVFSCAEALRDGLIFMRPQIYSPAQLPPTTLTAIPLLKDVLADRTIQPGIFHAAASIVNKIHRFSIGQTIDTQNNLFEDLLTAFLRSGLNRTDAVEATWKIMGVFGTRGANIATLHLFTDSSNAKMVSALGLFFQAAAILDSIYFGIGRNYSYPDEVTTTCDFGKPYHFWLPAYLSRRESLRFKSPVGSAAAAYIASVGYQMRSKTVGRDPVAPFTSDVGSLGNQKIRMDLAFAAAGAVYGSNPSFTGKLDVDLILKKLLESPAQLKPIRRSAAEALWKGTGINGYQRWIEIFRPQSALDVAWGGVETPR